MRRLRKGILAALAIGTLALGVGAPAQAAFDEPLFVFDQIPQPPPKLPIFPFEGPCGLAVDAVGNFYVSNYYRNTIEVYDPAEVPSDPVSRIQNVDPIDGPCGLAVGAGFIFVNNFHRNVERFTLAGTSAGVIDPFHPTGVALGPGATTLYVNQRSHVVAYDVGTGFPTAAIGADAIDNAYGLAVSGFAATLGYVYVPDAANDTVKVFDPTTDPDDPVQVIDGSELPGGGFGSLEDAAVAVDNVTGEIYVADTLGPQFSESPKAIVHAFDSTGVYIGRLKHEVIDSEPPGLAVDNSPTATQGRVYVTSGNTERAAIYAYPPGAAGFPPAPLAGSSADAAAAASPSPPSTPPARTATGSGAGGASASVITQKGSLRVAVSGRLAPKRLPRQGDAPISVTVAGKVSTTDQSPPPQLQTLEIELNREGRLDASGLPVCSYNAIQPASTSRALSACREALVGQGSFDAEIALAGQEPYLTGGRLLVFNGREGGKQVLFGQIYAERPFATSFVIVFKIKKLGGGTYGTALQARLPQALSTWGNLTGLEMTLKRQYTHRGRSHSYISAGCPAPKGFSAAPFPLARTTFGFEGGKKLSSVLRETCKVRG